MNDYIRRKMREICTSSQAGSGMSPMVSKDILSVPGPVGEDD